MWRFVEFVVRTNRGDLSAGHVLAVLMAAGPQLVRVATSANREGFCAETISQIGKSFFVSRNDLGEYWSSLRCMWRFLAASRHNCVEEVVTPMGKSFDDAS